LDFGAIELRSNDAQPIEEFLGFCSSAGTKHSIDITIVTSHKSHLHKHNNKPKIIIMDSIKKILK